MGENVAIIGASDNKDRYAYMAMDALLQNGHRVFLVNPSKTSIEGRTCYSSLTMITEKIDTVTVYVNPARLQPYISDIIKLGPTRVILNPGTEDDEIEALLVASGIKVRKACTLVMLKTSQW